MKSFVLALIVCLCVNYINARSILGYGDLAQNTISTIDNVHTIKYQKQYNPKPNNMLAFSSLSTNASYSFNAIYSNSDTTITWGVVSFTNGNVKDIQTIDIPYQYTVDSLNGFSLFLENNTIFYMGSYRSIYHDGNQYDFLTTSLDTGFQTALPVTVSSFPTHGLYDYTSGEDYYVVTITNNSQQYQCFWIDVANNEIINTITVTSSFVDTKFQIFSYQRNLYIVQSDVTGKYVEIYLVNWNTKTMSLFSRVIVPSPPVSLQVSTIANYVAIFSIDNNNTLTIPFINLSSVLVTNFLPGLSVSGGDFYFIF